MHETPLLTGISLQMKMMAWRKNMTVSIKHKGEEKNITITSSVFHKRHRETATKLYCATDIKKCKGTICKNK